VNRENESRDGRSGPLAGATVCLIYHGSIEHYTRLWEEIAALQRAGATVRMLTSVPQPRVPVGVAVEVVPFLRPIPGPSTLTHPTLRTLDNLARIPIRRLISLVRPDRKQHPRCRLRRLAREVDLFWPIDYFSLVDVVSATRREHSKVVYETFDLVPEYGSIPGWRRRLYRNNERRLMRHISGFITASESYADYYMERYGGRGLARRPVVRSNMPTHIVDAIRPTTPPIRLLFMGYLQADRPIRELIQAVSTSQANVTLTFQGSNRLGDAPQRWIAEMQAEDRVRVLQPCAPDKVVETAAEYDVGIVFLRGADENERRASTTKMFTCMSAGLAILGSDLPGIASIVVKHQNGVLVESADPPEWARAIDNLVSRGFTCLDRMKQNSLTAAHDYSWSKQEDAFVGEFVRALEGVPRSGSEIS
jgi:glycosyltransferase involved in cell wall biosynthesis